MAKKSPARKRGKKAGVKLSHDSGSPIGIDGGGSISIDFDEGVYPPGSDPDDHDGGAATKLKRLVITDASGNILDLTSLVSGNPNLCRIKIFHKNPSGTITLKGVPLGVNFSGKAFKQNQPGAPATSFHNGQAEITKVEVRYDGGFGKITLEDPAIGRCNIKVDKI